MEAQPATPKEKMNALLDTLPDVVFQRYPLSAAVYEIPVWKVKQMQQEAFIAGVQWLLQEGEKILRNNG